MFDHSDALDADGSRPAEPEPALHPTTLIHRAEAFGRGLNVHDIKRRLARGDWQIVRRGV